jgi:hypothetical protein
MKARQNRCEGLQARVLSYSKVPENWRNRTPNLWAFYAVTNATTILCMRNHTDTPGTANISLQDEETMSVRLQKVTTELRQLQDMLTSSEHADPRILTDFRDAVNRVRNTAWAVEQYANSKLTETDPTSVLSVLAGERVRVTYQLCKLVEGDLANPDIRFQIGQLMQLRDATKALEQELETAVESK